MELKLTQGDYVPDGQGGFCRLSGREAVLAQVLYRLRARRGALPFLPNLGSRLHLLFREKPSERQALAAKYVAEALEDQPEVSLAGVELSQKGECAVLHVTLNWQAETLLASLPLS